MKHGNKYKFTLLGGDRRLAYLADGLARHGHTIHLFAPSEDISFFSGAKLHSDYRSAIDASDTVILPMPVSKDGKHLNISGKDILSVEVSDVFMHAKRSGVGRILGGHVTKEIRQIAEACGVSIIDYSLDEELLQKNAEATAEGGIMIAMENTDVTLKDGEVLVCGFGRIAKHLCRLLSAFGAHVSVIARRPEILDEIRALGYKALSIGDTDAIRTAVTHGKVIFNTVPATVFDRRILDGKSRAVYIELASCPGGIDLKAAREMGLSVIFAPSLPGRYCPESAGVYILDGIYRILGEEDI